VIDERFLPQLFDELVKKKTERERKKHSKREERRKENSDRHEWKH